ncbi:MAG: hypothetical protein AB7F98_11240 [Novosphingobium sp.]
MPAASSLLRPRELGFVLTLRHGARSLLLALGMGLAFGVWMAAADTWLFSAAVPQVQHDMLHSMSALHRIAWFSRGALSDEILFRFVALTCLAWTIARYSGWRDGKAVWPAILAVALLIYPLGTWGYFASLDWSALTAAREVLLHGAAGVLWGWLYWRHGWLAGVAGHVAAHISLQPLLGAWS